MTSNQEQDASGADIKDRIEDHRRALLEPASTLFAVQRVHGEQVKEETMTPHCFGWRQLVNLEALQPARQIPAQRLLFN